MSEMLQESNVVCAGPAPLQGDAGWLAVLEDLAEAQPRTDTESLLRAFGEAAGRESSVAHRIAKLAPQTLDQLVLAGLFAEGQDLALRRRLRISGATVFQLEDFEPEDASTPGPARVLSAVRLVEWLGGESAAWREQVAQRLLPQAGLAARRLILRGGAATPLEGGVRLTPFLASLLYPGDDATERRLNKSLLLVRPKERLGDVVLSRWTKEAVESFLRLCRSHEGPGRAALLWGTAGTGKTLTARAIAGELGRPLLLARMSGANEESFLLEQAAAAAVIEGAVLFLDECGRWLKTENRNDPPSAAAAMLLEILQDHPGVVVAAMNQGWLNISEAFQRRFQFQVCYRGPGAEERVLLWRRHLRRPASPEDIEVVGRGVPLSGGLIANAAARLDAEAPGAPVSREELEQAARTQMVLTLDWEELYEKGASWRLKRAREELDKETRRALADLGLRLRRIRNLPVDFGRAYQPFKVCLWSDVYEGNPPLLTAAAYVATVARLAPLHEFLHFLTYQDADKGRRGSRPAVSRKTLESAFFAGYLPILDVEAKILGPGGIAQSPVISDFMGFSGAGIVLCRGAAMTPEFHPIAEWIKINPRTRHDVRRFLREQFPNLEIEPLDEALVGRLTKIKYQILDTVLRWALTRDPQASRNPGRLSKAAIVAALDAYERKPAVLPVFHA